AVGAAAIGAQVGLDLAEGAVGRGVGNSGPRATLGVVVAAVHRRAGVGAVVLGQLLGPDQGRVGGELAGERPRLRRDQAAEVAGVGQAVAEEHGAAVFP